MGYRPFLLKSLRKDILHLSKLKALADDKRNANKNLVLTWKKTMWEKKMLVSKVKALAYEKKDMQLKNIHLFLKGWL